MKLANPPIVESWIEFHTQGSDSEQTWPSELDRFLGEIKAEYPTTEQHFQETLQVVERSAEGMPVQLAGQRKMYRVRSFDEARRHCVQVGLDTLVVNLIKGDGPYEGFHHLLPTAIDQFDRFVRVFRPRAVMSAALHYTDVVRIPQESGSSSRLEDYFRIGVQVPNDETWILGRIGFDFTVSLSADTGESDELELRFRREPPDPGAAEHRFRIDWHAVCSKLDTLSTEVLSARLKKVHDAVKVRFRDCFEKPTWALFREESET